MITSRWCRQAKPCCQISAWKYSTNPRVCSRVHRRREHQERPEHKPHGSNWIRESARRLSKDRLLDTEHMSNRRWHVVREDIRRMTVLRLLDDRRVLDRAYRTSTPKEMTSPMISHPWYRRCNNLKENGRSRRERVEWRTLVTFMNDDATSITVNDRIIVICAKRAPKESLRLFRGSVGRLPSTEETDRADLRLGN